jgi:DnaK suppressor protein
MPKSQPKKTAAKKPKAAPAKAAKSAPKAAAKAAKPAEKKEAEAPVKPNGRPVAGPKKPVKMTPFLKQQRERLQLLRDTMLDSMAGVAKDTLRSRPEGSEASAFGMHQADAGSDAYDKDFALSLLSQEQDALYEIEEAIKRVDNGTYGVCEMSGKAIPAARLEALPFARLTVECQAEFERTKKFQRSRIPVTSLFGLTDSDDDDSDGEEAEEKPEKPQAEE